MSWSMNLFFYVETCINNFLTVIPYLYSFIYRSVTVRTCVRHNFTAAGLIAQIQQNAKMATGQGHFGRPGD